MLFQTLDKLKRQPHPANGMPLVAVAGIVFSIALTIFSINRLRYSGHLKGENGSQILENKKTFVKLALTS